MFSAVRYVTVCYICLSCPCLGDERPSSDMHETELHAPRGIQVSYCEVRA
jgi:hypothetical protein